jgi:hypothetical protein
MRYGATYQDQRYQPIVTFVQNQAKQYQRHVLTYTVIDCSQNDQSMIELNRIDDSVVMHGDSELLLTWIHMHASHDGSMTHYISAARSYCMNKLLER